MTAVSRAFLLMTIALIGGLRSLAAQVSVEALVRTDRYWGASTGFDDNGTRLSFRPFRPQLFGVRVASTMGRVRASVGAALSTPNLGAEGDDGSAVSLSGSNHQVEVDAEVALRVTNAGEAAGLWVFAAPMLNVWTFEDTPKTTIGGAIGFETEVALSRRFAAVTRISLAAQTSPFKASDLPEGYTTQAMWRRSIGIGLRYRL